MRRVRVVWQTEDTVEFQAEIEIPDDADLDSDYLHGDSAELINAEERAESERVSFYRTVQSVAPVEDR